MNEIWSQEEEAERLQKRFKALKLEKGIGQAEFARAKDVPGGPSLLSQHIKNRRPINLEAAIAYAKGFGCPIAEISPRLAKDIDAAQTAAWSSKDQPQVLKVAENDLRATGPIPGYSSEALALAWLLDQIPDRLKKAQANHNATAAVLAVLNAIDVAPTHTPVPRETLKKPRT